MNGSSSAVAVLCGFWPYKRCGSTASLLRKSDAKVVVVQDPSAEAEVVFLHSTLEGWSRLPCVLPQKTGLLSLHRSGSRNL